VILALILVLLICGCAGMLVVRVHPGHHPDYALTARLEHELLSGPYDHKACARCMEDKHARAMEMIWESNVRTGKRGDSLTSGAGRAWMAVVNPPSRGEAMRALTAADYFAMRPNLMVNQYNTTARPDATIKTLSGEDFRGTSQG
jgi:hypothetical protein